MPKQRFLVLMTDESLAALQSRFDSGTGRLEIWRDSRMLLDISVDDPSGVREAEEFMSSHLSLGAENRPVLARAGESRFTDVSVRSELMMNAVSLINLNTVRDFERRIGKAVDPLRFRANIYFDGWPECEELDLVGREIRIGDACLRVCLRTRRCPATQVNPQTSERDIDVPRE